MDTFATTLPVMVPPLTGATYPLFLVRYILALVRVNPFTPAAVSPLSAHPTSIRASARSSVIVPRDVAEEITCAAAVSPHMGKRV